jgi:hypothetical protein
VDDLEYIARPRERRRTKLPRHVLQQAAPHRVRDEDRRRSALSKALARGLTGDTAAPGVGRYVAYAVRAVGKIDLAAARRLVNAVEVHRPAILDSSHATRGLVYLAACADRWRRNPDRHLAQPPAASIATDGEAQLLALARHLVADYPMPAWFDHCWLDEQFAPTRWYVDVAQGRNLAQMVGLPFPLTRKMAHFTLALDPGRRPVTVEQALRYGQLRGVGVPEEVAAEAISTRLARPLPAEEFWLSFARWLARHPEVIGEVGILVDYLFAQRCGQFGNPPEPHLDVSRRQPDSLLREAHRWHMAQDGRHVAGPPRWKSCDIPGWPLVDTRRDPAPSLAPSPSPLAPVPPPDRVIVELTRRADLEEESNVLHHCVWTYGPSCASGAVAIFALRERHADGKLRPKVTIEVWPGPKQVVQVRGSCNRDPDPDDAALVRQWAKSVGLTVTQNMAVE